MPQASTSESGNNPTETATFAAGCFWGVEDTFRKQTAVLQTRVGYIGGHEENPSYHSVCTGTTGHTEAVEVTFNPNLTSYTALLLTFWSLHDPTTLNRQGSDIGSQYRSAIFYHSDTQKALAEQIKQQLDAQEHFSNPIVTEITPATLFFPAEEYHQQYVEKNGSGGCHI